MVLAKLFERLSEIMSVGLFYLLLFDTWSYYRTVICGILYTVKTIIRVDFLLIHLGFCRNFQIFRATEVCEK